MLDLYGSTYFVKVCIYLGPSHSVFLSVAFATFHFQNTDSFGSLPVSFERIDLSNYKFCLTATATTTTTTTITTFLCFLTMHHNVDLFQLPTKCTI